jgi:hypothetical protein
MFCPGVSFSSPANINYIDIPFLCYYMYWYVPSDLCFSVLDQMRQHHHIVTDISRGLFVFGSRTIHLYVSGVAHAYYTHMGQAITKQSMQTYKRKTTQT